MQQTRIEQSDVRHAKTGMTVLTEISWPTLS